MSVSVARGARKEAEEEDVQLVRRLRANPDPRPRVQRRSSDVTGSDTGRGRHGDRLGSDRPLASELPDDLSKQDGFSRSCSSRKRVSQPNQSSQPRDLAKNRTRRENVPADPVKKMFMPLSTTISSTFFCSSDRTIAVFLTFGRAGVLDP